MNKEQIILRERKRIAERMRQLIGAGYSLGVDPYGYGRQARPDKRATFSESEVPGLCRTCRYSIIQDNNMPGVGQPVVTCTAGDKYRQVPPNYTRCTQYFEMRDEEEPIVALTEQLLSKAILLPKWEKGERQEPVYPWTTAGQDAEEEKVLLKEGTVESKERLPGPNAL